MQPQNPSERDNANERYIDLQALQPSRDVSLTLGANRHSRHRTATLRLFTAGQVKLHRGLTGCIDDALRLGQARAACRAITRAPGH